MAAPRQAWQPGELPSRLVPRVAARRTEAQWDVELHQPERQASPRLEPLQLAALREQRQEALAAKQQPEHPASPQPAQEPLEPQGRPVSSLPLWPPLPSRPFPQRRALLRQPLLPPTCENVPGP